MRVLLDATAGARPHLSGIGRYVHGIVTALAALPEAPPFDLGVRFTKWKGRSLLPRATGGRALKVRPLDDRLDWFLLRNVELFHGLDVRITRSKKPARLATLHDVFSIERDDLATESFRTRKIEHYKRLADEADAVICVSKATEDGFHAAFPRARARTTVVHHGISEAFTRADAQAIARVRARNRLNAPFLLFVGLLSTRKNLVALLDAFAEIAKRRADLDLVLAGKESHGFEEIAAAIERHPFKGRVKRVGFVPDAELPALYSAAELMVFPSLTEGFGLPVLEAFACGTPVVASNLPVFREIGGSELVVADAKDPGSLAAAIVKTWETPIDDARRARLAAHAAQFTWQAAGRKTLQVWIDALAHRGKS
jgi:glycosyltransferase involved in cell wall biosynthesis